MCYTATHVMLRRQGQVVAYARLYDDYTDRVTFEQAIARQTPARVMCVGRMLTTERGKGLGRLLMQYIVAEAKRQGAVVLRLHAQQQAVGFYRRLRFRTIGEPFDEAGIPHILMERKLRIQSAANLGCQKNNDIWQMQHKNALRNWNVTWCGFRTTRTSG